MPVDTFKVLAQGTLPNVIGVLYTAPNVGCIVRYMTLVNNSGNDRPATLAVNGSGTSNQILPATTILAGGFGEWDGVLTLHVGDTIQGLCSVNAAITYTIFGDEVN